MPYIVSGESSNLKQVDYSSTNFDYEYPNELDLKPGSDFHDKLVSKIIERANLSRLEISKRFSSWNTIDETLTTYIPLKDVEKDLKDKDRTKPISIVFPYTYSMLEALLTYMSMAFFQEPMFQYEGIDDDDTTGAMLLELLIKVHCIKNKVPLSVHTTLRDALSYGVGPGIPIWETRYGKIPVKSKVIREGELGNDESSQVDFIEDLIFEGNGLANIDPYMWLPDPSVSSVDIQKGEFNGWVDRVSYLDMLSSEVEKDSSLFNVKYLKLHNNKTSALSLDNSKRGKRDSRSKSDTVRNLGNVTNYVDNINMYINLIPKDWGLSDREYPQKWFFCLSADAVITRCEPADHNHGMYPMAVASPEFDGYSIAPIGRLEILSGLQTTLDFLFNSHIENVRKSINDMLIVDPYLVNINDLKDPQPGKLIRLRRPAWGRGVDKVVQQLTVQDITRANIGDSTYITQWMDRISGADQSMQGAIRQGGPERLTRSEFQGTRGSAISRLQRIAMLVGMQYMQDIGTMFAVHTQQYMKKETFVKIAGRYEQDLMKTFGKSRAKVSPFDIAVNYDLIVRDGSIPGGNFSESWIQLFSTIGSSPELMQQFDIVRIFTYIAQQMGAKNVEDFKRNVGDIQATTLPDDQVEEEARKGNLVPTEAL